MSIRSLAFFLILAGCSNAPAPCGASLSDRAYIVSRDSDEVHMIDLSSLEVCGVAHTGGQALHMGELNKELTEIFVDSETTNETVVVDTRSLKVVKRIETSKHPTHITLTRDGKLFGVVAEGDDAIMFMNPETMEIIRTIPGFHLPHFIRYSLDGTEAYVANLESHHISRINLSSFAIMENIVLDGFTDKDLAPNEGGFADVQIDQVTGLLYAASRETGRVLVYDTLKHKKVSELQVGQKPWIVYAEHPFEKVSRRHVVPNFGDQSASIIKAAADGVEAPLMVADQETFGVNYSPLVPDQAFLMNREKHEIAVIDTAANHLIDRIDVGGTTETASTTADGKWIVATVSSANAVVIIDAVTHHIVKRFDNLGHYPWSVTIPGGQNYCH